MNNQIEHRLLFLDDVRDPKHCAAYMRHREPTLVDMYAHAHWEIVRNYDDFVAWINANGLPDLISFDHDLADDHYHEKMYAGVEEYENSIKESTAMTGKECAEYLVNYCVKHNQRLPYCAIHSMNPAGCERIAWTLNQYEKMGGSIDVND